MFKNKITFKLSGYFTAALLVFSIIISGLFVFLFRNYTLDVHQTELANRAESIALTLGECIDTGNDLSSMRDYGLYLLFIGDIAGTDVWIIDSDRNIITRGTRHSMVNSNYRYADLPRNAESIVREVFTDKTVFSKDFSGVLAKLTLTVGAPIQTRNGVAGAVLLHSPARGVNKAVYNVLAVLMTSIIAALLIALALSVRFSFIFTKPLNKINETALLLADGDYSAKSGITQHDEIGQLAASIDILAARLDEASRQSAKLEQMRKDFAANISHELRTPITVMRGSLEALTDKVVTDPAQVETYHRKMLEETVFLQRLVGDLLDLSKLQNMDFVIEKRDIPLSGVLEDVIGSAAQIAKNKGVNVAVDTGSVNYTIHADYGRIRQMLLIALDNAVKFSPEGGTVDVTLADKTISIRDYGAGIPAADLPYIFDRFYKSRTEQNKTGTGLGLAIAKQIAGRHGIRLSVTSEESKGTCFMFTF